MTSGGIETNGRIKRVAESITEFLPKTFEGASLDRVLAESKAAITRLQGSSVGNDKITLQRVDDLMIGFTVAERTLRTLTGNEVE